jgi:gliding motility-associated-like protein
MRKFKNLFIILLLFFSNTAISQTVCKDTSELFYIQNDTLRFYIQDYKKAPSGVLLISGQYEINLPPLFIQRTGAFVIKSDINGNIIWQKQYDSANGIILKNYYYNNIIELRDSSILATGKCFNKNSNEHDIIVTKLSSSGNILWSKIFNSWLWKKPNENSDFYYNIQMKQDISSDDIFVSGRFSHSGNSITRLNSINGNIIWSKSYNMNPNNNAVSKPFGIDVKMNELRLFCNVSGSGGLINMYQINKLTGDTIKTTGYKIQDINAYNLQFFDPEPLQILSNGNYIFSGSVYGNLQINWDSISPRFHSAVAEFDSNFVFIRAYCFTNNSEIFYRAAPTTLYNDGSGLSYMVFAGANSQFAAYIVQFKNGKILKQRIKYYKGQNTFGNLGKTTKLPNGSDLIITSVSDTFTPYKSRIEFLKINLTDTLPSCLGDSTNTTALYIYNFVNINPLRDSISSNVFQEILPNKIITSKDIATYKSPVCFQVSYCDSLKLIPNKNIICLSQALQVVTRKNKSCGSNVDWNYDTSAIQSIIKVNDSTSNINFKKTWSGFIYGRINSCSTITDSILIQVLQSPISLNLGSDYKICTNTKTILNAHSGYASYKWQDGSTDSTFTVTQAGQYFVETIDACGGKYFDTINISYFLPLPTTKYDTLKGCNSVTHNSFTYTSNSIVIDTIKSKNICDSVYNQYNIIVYQVTPKNIIDTLSGCGSVFYNGTTYSNSTTLKDTIKTAFGCDSIYNIHQIIVQQYNSTTKVDSIFGCNSIVYKGIVYNNDTVVKDTSKTIYGCDSLYSTHYIFIQKIIAITTNDTIVGCGKVVYKTNTYLVNTLINDTIISSFGCDSILNVHNIVILPKPIISVTKDTTICFGDTAKLYAISNANVFWVNSITNPLIIYPPYDTVSKAIAINNFNCKDSATTKVSVQHFAINISLSPNPASKGDNIFVTTQSVSNYNIYNWSSSPNTLFFNNTNTTINFKADSNCIVVAKGLSIEGCKDSAFGELIVRPNLANVFIPNAFSPNNDNINDYWVIKNLNLFLGTTVTVFNRNGQIVFNSVGYNKPWNGTFMNTGQLLPLGVYYYIIKIGGELSKIFNGTITILK